MKPWEQKGYLDFILLFHIEMDAIRLTVALKHNFVSLFALQPNIQIKTHVILILKIYITPGFTFQMKYDKIEEVRKCDLVLILPLVE